ncbi:hypothetical protein GL177_19165 [Vibrio toranzoniae]|uniref:hypothetical protein n=1 Tax=Vibrio toranzoniae TaxID=1194427 RepID=UPI001376C962|nr:hypothetical protein [Vibrio toranzoniae]NAZ55434.1 hypothetical protein [Vibrio toranzoniae]
MAFGISTWVDGQEDMIHMTPFNYIEEHALVVGTRTITVNTSKYSGTLDYSIEYNSASVNSAYTVTSVRISGNKLTYTCARRSLYYAFGNTGGKITLYARR